MTFEKPPTVRLNAKIAEAYGLTPTRILKDAGVYEKQYDVPFLGFVGDSLSIVRLMIFGHGPRDHMAVDVEGLNKSFSEDKKKEPPRTPADRRQADFWPKS